MVLVLVFCVLCYYVSSARPRANSVQRYDFFFIYANKKGEMCEKGGICVYLLDGSVENSCTIQKNVVPLWAQDRKNN